MYITLAPRIKWGSSLLGRVVVVGSAQALEVLPGYLPAQGTCDRQEARINRRFLSAIVFAGALWARVRILRLGRVVLSHVPLLVAKAILEGPAQRQPPGLLPRRASK